MIDKTFNLDEDFELLMEAMLKANAPEVLDKHRSAMKIAYAIAIYRMADETEKFENLSWDETEELKKSIKRQGKAFFIDAEQTTIINEMLREVNEENKVDKKRELRMELAWMYLKVVFVVAILMVIIDLIQKAL